MKNVLRTAFVSFGLVASSATLASAELLSGETLIHDTTTQVEIELDATTVLCSAADYLGTFHKIGTPELSALTLHDHQNTGANAPCVAAGECAPGNMPEDIIDPADPTETVGVRVRAYRYDTVDTTKDTCETSLKE